VDILPLDADEIAACAARSTSASKAGAQTTAGLTAWDQLPAAAQRYLEYVQAVVGVPIDMVSTGPDREHTIVLRHPFQELKGTPC
jgi:adenylosuccinate synthase